MRKEPPFYTLNLGGRLCLLNSPLVMGILNITQDSFYEASRSFSTEAMALRVRNMIDEGVDIIDVGACSTRPGAIPIGEEEERLRLDKALAVIRKENAEIVVSVDTFRARIAEWCVKEYGVQIINDVTAGAQSDKMFETVAKLQVPYILTHSDFNEVGVNSNPVASNNNLWKETISFLSERLERLRLMGVNDVIIDPGFGFGKTLDDNYRLMAYLEDFHILGCPLLVGVSRKSMIYNLLNSTPDKALNGTTVLHTIALTKGVHILRTHDVKAAVEAVRLVEQIRKS